MHDEPDPRDDGTPGPIPEPEQRDPVNPVPIEEPAPHEEQPPG